jgi:small-conductance mechanosensitive channel
MFSKTLVIYFVVVGAVGIIAILWSRHHIRTAEEKRAKRIRGLRRFNPVKTSTPVDEPIKEARENALESVENRFSIIRRLSFISLVVLWLFALSVPLLNALPATVISITVAASGVIIGMAARPFIENLISGVVISFSHPIRIGDTVILDDHYGTVEDITITHTVLRVWNWRRYIVPNSRMLAKELINCTINDAYQWAHVEFSVAYDTDLEQVRNIARRAATSSRYFADYEPPSFWIMEMAEKGYRCWVAAWADSPSDAWELRNDIRTEMIRSFNVAGIKAHRFELEGTLPVGPIRSTHDPSHTGSSGTPLP